jgi:transposase
MQKTRALRDGQRERVRDALPGKHEDPGRAGADSRLFAGAGMWVARTGSPWRRPPPERGKR